MTHKYLMTTAIGLTLLATGCSQSDEPTSSVPHQGSAQLESQGQAHHQANSGRVVDMIDVPGYTYLQVESNGNTQWVAGSPIEVTKGDVVSWENAIVMENFTSKTLNREFKSILFAASVKNTSNTNSASLSQGNQAKVISIQSVADYTYIEAKKGDSETNIWLAVPITDIKAGETITWDPGTMMRNFTSSSLQKTFPEIIFSSAARVLK